MRAVGASHRERGRVARRKNERQRFRGKRVMLVLPTRASIPRVSTSNPKLPANPDRYK